MKAVYRFDFINQLLFAHLEEHVRNKAIHYVPINSSQLMSKAKKTNVGNLGRKLVKSNWFQLGFNPPFARNAVMAWEIRFTEYIQNCIKYTAAIGKHSH